MMIFTKLDGSSLWWVFCHNPSFYLGPDPTEDAAEEIRMALKSAYNFGREEIQEGIRDLLGLQNVGN